VATFAGLAEGLEARELLEELARREEKATLVPDVLAAAFDKQRAFITDPALLKALFCTRRSAKSYTAGLYLVYEALQTPGSNLLFVGLTRESAKGIIWKDVLSDIDRTFGLGMQPNQTELTMTLPNGSVIKCTGVDADEEEMNKLLGRKWRLACIDEASMYTIDLRNFVYGILGPAVVDNGGTIALFGTASNFPRGLFFDITTRKEPGWKLYEWTAHDNPHVAANWQKALDDIARDRPLYMETPQFKQWFLNQWVIDDTKLVYRFTRERNLVAQLPQLPAPGWTVVLGVDLGWEDETAFVLTAYHVNDPHLYVLCSYAAKHMEFDGVADRIRMFMGDAKWAPHKVVIDGANKQGVESMRSRAAIPFEYADKLDKVTFIELANNDLVQGKVKILDTPENRQLWQEMLHLVWVTDGDKIKYPKRENPTLPNHRCDAYLYAWRMGFHFHFPWAPLERKHPIGSRAWIEQQTADIWERERENLERTDTDAGGWPELN
jgi:hypothetical protein